MKYPTTNFSLPFRACSESFFFLLRKTDKWWFKPKVCFSFTEDDYHLFKNMTSLVFSRSTRKARKVLVKYEWYTWRLDGPWTFIFGYTCRAGHFTPLTILCNTWSRLRELHLKMSICIYALISRILWVNWLVKYERTNSNKFGLSTSGFGDGKKNWKFALVVHTTKQAISCSGLHKNGYEIYGNEKRSGKTTFHWSMLDLKRYCRRCCLRYLSLRLHGCERHAIAGRAWRTTLFFVEKPIVLRSLYLRFRF